MSTGEALPPFSGTWVHCPKCKLTVVETTWHCVGGERGFPCADTEVGEHMCRTCECCKYGWLEATADAGGTGRSQ
jgi:hypothetical protein